MDITQRVQWAGVAGVPVFSSKVKGRRHRT